MRQRVPKKREEKGRVKKTEARDLVCCSDTIIIIIIIEKIKNKKLLTCKSMKQT